MLILAIETSCDETSVAILKNKTILSNTTITQILEQQKYGGVVPILAAKLHLKNIQKVLSKALTKANIDQKEIDYVAYTEKPGLVICLQIGKVIAETISLYLNKPLIPCNHLEGHIYASLIEHKSDTGQKKWEFPVLALVISGGHTQLYYLKEHLNFKLLGQTLDDAIGECLDKVSLLLNYSYPGGPIIEKLALEGKYSYQLPLSKIDNTYDFSFSGLKTAVRRTIEKEGKKLDVNDLAYSLQHTLAKVLTWKIRKFLKEQKVNTIVVGGGVSANKYLTNYLKKEICNKKDQEINLLIPFKEYCTDNAAMIGILAYYKLKYNKLAILA